MRLFVGIDLDSTERDALASLFTLDRDPGIAWVPRENLHLTLKFLGSVPPERLEAVKRALREAVTSCLPFELRLQGVGTFPGAIWVGAVGTHGEESSELKDVVQKIELALSKVGFPLEQRPFVAHLTIGRIKEKRKTLWLPSAVKDWSGGTFTVSEVTLFESQTLPEGAKYTVLDRYELPAQKR